LETSLLEKLINKEISKAQLSLLVEADFGLVPTLFAGTSSTKAVVRYGCGSVLMDLTEKHPDRLYPYVDKFIGLLESKYRILTWNAMKALANLTVVDIDHKFDNIFEKYFNFLNNEYMITVANAVANSTKIAINKPYLADRIVQKLLKVQNLETTSHLTEECKLVIAEKTIETFNVLVNYVKNRKALIDFAKEYQNNQRTSLNKGARLFLKKWK
jgi:hypothetical protein